MYVTVTKNADGEMDFFFDAAPGSYDAIVSFSNASGTITIRNGPLVVIANRDRHLFVAGCGLADWHAAAAIAGALPATNVTLSVLTFDQPQQCGEDFRSLDQRTLKPLVSFRTWGAAIDNGAYYANFYLYGKQRRTVALLFTGALFTEGAVLLTSTPDTTPERPPLISKNITPEIVEAATRAHDKLICVDGF